MNNEIRIFENEQFGKVRTLLIDGQPWFVGKDVGKALGYSNTRDALSKHVDTEDKTTVAICDTGSNYKSQAVIINESGVYSLIFSSKLEGARQFKRWVTSEVLPSIRKYGAYLTEEALARVTGDTSEAISSFAILFMKYRSPSDEWKLIYHNAKSLEKMLHGERWLAMSVIPEKILESDDDLSSLIALAEQGHNDAQLKLGKAYYHGDRIQKDDEKAHLWIRKAALQGNAEAQYYLGNCIRNSVGVDFVPGAEMRWYKMSANKGFSPAQYEIGFNLLLSKQIDSMTSSEKNELYKWIKLSADQEYPAAIWVLSILYKLGAGVVKDAKKADMLIHKASELGYSHATIHLAHEFEKSGDLEKAIEMYTRAKSQGESTEGSIRRLKRKLGI